MLDSRRHQVGQPFLWCRAASSTASLGASAAGNQKWTAAVAKLRVAKFLIGKWATPIAGYGIYRGITRNTKTQLKICFSHYMALGRF